MHLAYTPGDGALCDFIRRIVIAAQADQGKSKQPRIVIIEELRKRALVSREQTLRKLKILWMFDQSEVQPVPGYRESLVPLR